jgi:plastocyanin
VASTVTVTPDCTGIAAGDIDIEFRAPSTTGFRIMGDNVDNPDLNLNVGDIVAFQTPNNHNFAAGAGTAAANDWTSGAPGNHRACMTFTAAFTGTYQCDNHPGTMNGDIVVAP